jgi:HAD superfamily hydrolase (TIGR01509 family)
MVDEFDVVLFDNDGVLVDTEPLFLQASRDLLATIGIELELADYRELSLRQGRSAFELARDRGLSDPEIEDLRRRRNLRYSELIEEGVRVLAGVSSTLERLHGRRPMAIVTSSDRVHFDQIHRQTDLLRFFDFVLANDEYDRHKPHPEPYLTAAERFGVAPERCLVIEDTERGLRSAEAAGMRCIVIPHTLSAEGDFGAAEHVLEDMHALASLLGL